METWTAMPNIVNRTKGGRFEVESVCDRLPLWCRYLFQHGPAVCQRARAEYVAPARFRRGIDQACAARRNFAGQPNVFAAWECSRFVGGEKRVLGVPDVERLWGQDGSNLQWSKLDPLGRVRH